MKKKNVFFLENQFMLSLRFMLFKKQTFFPRGGGGSLRIRPSYSDDTFDCQYSTQCIDESIVTHLPQ